MLSSWRGTNKVSQQHMVAAEKVADYSAWRNCGWRDPSSEHRRSIILPGSSFHCPLVGILQTNQAFVPYPFYCGWLWLALTRAPHHGLSCGSPINTSVSSAQSQVQYHGGHTHPSSLVWQMLHVKERRWRSVNTP